MATVAGMAGVVSVLDEGTGLAEDEREGARADRGHEAGRHQRAQQQRSEQHRPPRLDPAYAARLRTHGTRIYASGPDRAVGRTPHKKPAAERIPRPVQGPD